MAVLKAFDFPVPEQVIKVLKLSFRRGCMKNLRILPIEHQTTEELVEVPTVVLCSRLPSRALTFQVQVEVVVVHVEVFKVCTQDRILQRGWASRSLTFQFRVVVEGWAVEVFKGFLQDRIQQRLVEHRSLTFQFAVEVPKGFAQDRVSKQLHPQALALRKWLLMGFFALFPE